MAVLVSDSFNRADSTTTLGTTDSYNGGTTKTWTMYGPAANLPTYGISTNRAYMVSNNGGFTTASYAGIDVAQSDVKYTLTLATSAAVSFILRASNNNHYITLAMGNPITLNTFNAGTTTQIASAGVASAAGDVFEVTLNGTTITVLKNGSQIISATSTFNQTSTIFGFSGGGSTAARFDSYQVEDLATGGTNATVTGIAATATNSAVAPSISGNAAISSIAANSTMSGIAPSVSADANVTAIAATVTASANAPFIGQVTEIVAVAATASVQAVAPSVSTVRQVTVNSIAANSTASMRIANIIVVLPVYPKIILAAERITQIPLSAERVVMIQLQAGGGRMTKENQNFDMYAGDGFELLFPLPSKKDDLSTASITWTLKDRLGGTVLLTKTVGSGITVDGSSFTVHLDGVDTSGREGRFFYVGKITKDGVTSTSVTGHIKIETT